jgi:aminoglycoside phosphotransferase (APT) family kinase protein
MAVKDEFPEDNFLRATRHANTARVLAHLLSSNMRELFPKVIKSDVRISAVDRQGWCNLTFWVNTADGTPLYVLRLCERPPELDSLSVPKFEKERYVLGRLSASLLAPRVPEHGSGIIHLTIPGRGVVTFGYLFQTQLSSRACHGDHGERHRHEIFSQLGRIARDIHSTQLEGFGSDFDENLGRFRFGSYHDVIDAMITRVDCSPVDRSFKRWLIARLKGLEYHDPAPTLFHQDLLANWGNVLLDSNQQIGGIVDWEFAGSGLAFHNELAAFLYVHTRDGIPLDRTEHDLLSILDGYGIPHSSYVAYYEQDVQTLVLVHAVTAVQKLDSLMQSGGLEKEPWRKVFAERASNLCLQAIKSKS